MRLRGRGEQPVAGPRVELERVARTGRRSVEREDRPRAAGVAQAAQVGARRAGRVDVDDARPPSRGTAWLAVGRLDHDRVERPRVLAVRQEERPVVEHHRPAGGHDRHRVAADDGRRSGVAWQAVRLAREAAVAEDRDPRPRTAAAGSAPGPAGRPMVVWTCRPARPPPPPRPPARPRSAPGPCRGSRPRPARAGSRCRHPTHPSWWRRRRRSGSPSRRCVAGRSRPPRSSGTSGCSIAVVDRPEARRLGERLGRRQLGVAIGRANTLVTSSGTSVNGLLIRIPAASPPGPASNAAARRVTARGGRSR